jgi:N-acetylmuramoyl-L-alanine amidase
MREIKYIVIHCTAGPSDQTVEAIKGYWKNKLGWKSPGYHHLIEADGNVVNLEDIKNPTNGVANYNANSIHISYIGGVEVVKGKNDKGAPINVLGKTKDTRTEEQRCAMLNLVSKYHRMFPKAKILGHRDFSPDKNRNGIIEPSEWMKTCPSFSVKEWLKTVTL